MNLRPSGYEPDELPDCSTPRQECNYSRSCPFRSTRARHAYAGRTTRAADPVHIQTRLRPPSLARNSAASAAASIPSCVASAVSAQTPIDNVTLRPGAIPFQS